MTIAVGGTWWRSPGWPNPAWVYDNADHLCATQYKLGEMLAPNTPPIEMRSPGAKSGLAGLGLMVTPSGVYQNGGTAPSFLTMGTPGANPTNVVQPGTLTNPYMPPIPMTTPMGTTNPVFYDTNGNVITQAVCGSVYGMTVPGYGGQVLHIVQTKNGAPQINAQMQMPTPNYASVCNQDEGTYFVQAFTQSGQLLGGTTFNVLPSASSPGTGPSGLPPLPAATNEPPSASAPSAPAPGTTSSTSNVPAAATTTPTTTPATTVVTSATPFGLSTTDWLIILVLGAVVVSSSKGR